MLTFKIREHSVVSKQVIEVWEGGKFIGTIAPGDGVAIRFVSKYDLDVIRHPDNPLYSTEDGRVLKAVEVCIKYE